MPDELPLPPDESSSPGEPEEQPAGLASVARRVSRRTTDLLAIAVVAIGVFAVSGRISDWWNTPPDSVLAPSRVVPQVVGTEVGWPEMDIPVGLNLGDLPVHVERLQIQGSRKKLEDVIFARLRSVLNSPALPLPQDEGNRISSAAGKVERLLAGIEPVEEKSAAWRIYRLDEPGTLGFSDMFLGTRLVPENSGAQRERLVTWAMSMPWRQDEWKVFFFQSAQGESQSIILPPDAELTMSMQEPSGTELAAFRAKGSSASLSEWREFYSRRLVEAGWKPAREWAQSETRSTARFENDSHAVEIILKDESGRLSGLASVIRLSGEQSR